MFRALLLFFFVVFFFVFACLFCHGDNNNEIPQDSVSPMIFCFIDDLLDGLRDGLIDWWRDRRRFLNWVMRMRIELRIRISPTVVLISHGLTKSVRNTLNKPIKGRRTCILLILKYSYVLEYTCIFESPCKTESISFLESTSMPHVQCHVWIHVKACIHFSIWDHSYAWTLLYV